MIIVSPWLVGSPLFNGVLTLVDESAPAGTRSCRGGTGEDLRREPPPGPVDHFPHWECAALLPHPGKGAYYINSSCILSLSLTAFGAPHGRLSMF